MRLRLFACALLLSSWLLVGCGDGSDESPPVEGSNPTASDVEGPPEVHEQGERRTAAGMDFVWIPAGSFTMGSPESETGRQSDEDSCEVTLTRGFWLATTEVTQAIWQEVMGTNSSQFEGDSLPVERVSWHDANDFMEKLGSANGMAFRLPTEAEWEHACRAGTATAFSFGDTLGGSLDYGWYDENSGGQTHPVGEKLPNPWGLFDMHGNLAEWCQGSLKPYTITPVTDPPGTLGGSQVLRGGSWGSKAIYARSANRDDNDTRSRQNWIGFRVASSRL